MSSSYIPGDRPAKPHRICLENVETLYADGRWNGRPSFVFWRDEYYIAFRSSLSHDTIDDEMGKVLMLKSTDLKDWKVSTVIDGPEIDGAEPLLLGTDDRLYMYIVAENPITTTFMSYSEDGVEWAKPVKYFDDGFSFNTPVTHKGIHYGALDYAGAQQAPVPGERSSGYVDLMQSTDGLEWTKVSRIVEDGTETALVFMKDDTLLTVIRQGWVTKAKPPYTDWQVVDSKEVGLGGPDAALVGNTVLVAGRHNAQTTLMKLHPDTMSLDFIMDMPIHNVKAQPTCSVAEAMADTEIASTEEHAWPMGDKAYPEFLVLDDHNVLMAYYDGQSFEAGVPKQADIRLATITVH
jgi:hypothetical protein